MLAIPFACWELVEDSVPCACLDFKLSGTIRIRVFSLLLLPPLDMAGEKRWTRSIQRLFEVTVRGCHHVVHFPTKVGAVFRWKEWPAP
jgi:hypothetical protein